jgi:quinol monooxygenase YgiN
VAKTTEVAFYVEFEVNEGNQADLEEFLPAMMAAAKEEPGTLAYHCYRSADSNLWCFYELYSNSDAAMVHMDNFDRTIAPTYMPLIRPTRIIVLGDLSDDLRSRLAPVIEGQIPGVVSAGLATVESYPA